MLEQSIKCCLFVERRQCVPWRDLLSLRERSVLPINTKGAISMAARNHLTTKVWFCGCFYERRSGSS
jgi:hypothetical protein